MQFVSEFSNLDLDFIDMQDTLNKLSLTQEISTGFGNGKIILQLLIWKNN